MGRGLAFLGYGASGEIASSEEMEAFLEEQGAKKLAQLEYAEVDLKKCETLAELRSVFTGFSGGLMADPGLIKIKDELKTQLKSLFLTTLNRIQKSGLISGRGRSPIQVSRNSCEAWEHKEKRIL